MTSWAATKITGLFNRLRRLFTQLGAGIAQFTQRRQTSLLLPASGGLSQVGVAEELRRAPPASDPIYFEDFVTVVWDGTDAHPLPEAPAASAPQAAPPPPTPPRVPSPPVARVWQHTSSAARQSKAWADPFPEVRYFRLTEEELPLVDTASTSSSSGLGSEEEAQ